MSIWDYIIPAIGNTIGGVVGPLQEAKPLQERLLRSAGGLASLFTRPVTSLATYSPEAEGALVPASAIESKLGSRATRAGVTPDKLLSRKDIVYDGKNWNRYIHDDINKENVLKALRENDTSQSLLRRFWKHDSDDPRLRAIGTTGFRFDPTLSKNKMSGSFEPSVSRYQSGSISVNPDTPYNDIKNSIRHESQHALDNYLGRSDGMSFDPFGMDQDLYLHNMGEVRARLNAAIGGLREGDSIPGKQLNPKQYEGLQDLFYEGQNQIPGQRPVSGFKRYRLEGD